jgi:hypothetical protein
MAKDFKFSDLPKSKPTPREPFVVKTRRQERQERIAKRRAKRAEAAKKNK